MAYQAPLLLQGVSGFQELRISTRTLRPFAVISRDGATFHVDAFSFDTTASASGSGHPADLWEIATSVNLPDDIKSATPYPISATTAKLNATTRVITLCFARVLSEDNDEHALICTQPPSENLRPSLFATADAEYAAEASMHVPSAAYPLLSSVIFHSVQQQPTDIAERRLAHAFQPLQDLNARLNRFDRPSMNDGLDWVSASKVLQRTHRTGLIRYAAAIARALWASTRRFLPSLTKAGSAEYGAMEIRTIIGRVIGDVLVRDSHRLLGSVGGLLTAILGSNSQSTDRTTLILAGITMCIASLSLASRSVRQGRRCATREMILGTGASFNHTNGAGYAFGRNDERSIRVGVTGEVKEPLEVGVLEATGYRFFVDIGGSVMCVAANGKVAGCVASDDGRIVIDTSSTTDSRFLACGARLDRHSMIG